MFSLFHSVAQFFVIRLSISVSLDLTHAISRIETRHRSYTVNRSVRGGAGRLGLIENEDVRMSDVVNALASFQRQVRWVPLEAGARLLSWFILTISGLR